MATKKSLAEKAKKILDTVEEEIKKPYTIESTFALGGSTPLALKNDLCWLLRLNIKTILDRSFHKYNIKMLLDQAPYEERIAEIDLSLRRVQEDETLPDMEDKEKIRRLEERREKVKADLEKMIKETDEISLTATVVNIKYSGNATVVDFNIPADQIELLNKNRFYFSYYKIELEPLLDRIIKDINE